MKVVVVNPPKLFNPYETYLMIGTVSFCPDGNWLSTQDLVVANILMKEGHEVVYVDGDNRNLDLVQTAKEVLDQNPDWVVMNSETIDYARSPLPSYENVNTIAEIIKAELPEVKIVLYGTHVAIDTSTISEYIDYRIKGEPEGVIAEVLRGRPVDFSKVQHADLCKIPPPAYELAENVPKNPSEYAAKALSKGEKFTVVNWARGCPFKCVFCCRVGLGSEYRVKWNIREELEALEENDYTSFYIIDDTFGLDKAWLKHFLKEVKEFNFKWCVQTRVDVVRDPETVKEMKKAGCVQVGIGVESYNDDLLRMLKKSSSVRLIDEAMENLRRYGLDVVAFTMLGLPSETEEHRIRTSEWIEKNSDILVGAGPFLITPYPTTELWSSLVLKQKVRSKDVRESLLYAGLFGDWDNLYSARKEWVKYDKMWGFGADVLSMVEKYRPKVYERWKAFVRTLL